MAKGKLTQEQQDSLDEFARCIYIAEIAGDAKKAEVKKDVFKKCVLDFAEALDEGVPVSFNIGKDVVQGVLRTKYSRNWEFIPA